MKLPAETLTIACSAEMQTALESVIADIKAITQSNNVVFSKELTDAAEDKTNDITIQVEMDKVALYRTELISEIKPTINALKKPHGLKAKSPIAKLYVKASGEELAALQSEPAQLAASARAGVCEINVEGLEYTESAHTGIFLAIEV